MNDYVPLLTAVSRLLNYLRDRDVVDEIQTVGNVPVQSWKSEEFRRRIKETQEAFDAVRGKSK